MNDKQAPNGPLVKLVAGTTTAAASFGISASRTGIKTFSNCNRANRTQPYANPGRVMRQPMQQNKFSNPLMIHRQKLLGTLSGDFRTLRTKPRPEALHIWQVTQTNLILKFFFLFCPIQINAIFFACLLNKQPTYSIFFFQF